MLVSFASANAKVLFFALPDAKIPNASSFASQWNIGCNFLYFLHYPTPNLKFALAPTPTPDASQWNIGGVGSQRKILALAMYISFFVCRFHSHWVANANPISSGIWAYMYYDQYETRV